MALLDVQNVSVSYGKNVAIEDISLSVERGSIFGLVGLNGAGKTSLIKTILGLRDQASGKILVEGQQNDSMQSKAKIAYLPERFDPPWFLSGLEFIKFSLKLYKRKVEESTIFAESEVISLDPAVLKKRVQTYSKGMRQKLGLLATILTGCEMLILDEPMSGLDPRARLHVKEMIERGRQGGQTIFLSSHILADVYALCDTVAVLHDRRILFTGTPQALCDKTEQSDMEHAFLHLIEDGFRAAA